MSISSLSSLSFGSSSSTAALPSNSTSVGNSSSSSSSTTSISLRAPILVSSSSHSTSSNLSAHSVIVLGSSSISSISGALINSSLSSSSSNLTSSSTPVRSHSILSLINADSKEKKEAISSSSSTTSSHIAHIDAHTLQTILLSKDSSGEDLRNAITAYRANHVATPQFLRGCFTFIRSIEEHEALVENALEAVYSGWPINVGLLQEMFAYNTGLPEETPIHSEETLTHSQEASTHSQESSIHSQETPTLTPIEESLTPLEEALPPLGESLTFLEETAAILKNLFLYPHIEGFDLDCLHFCLFYGFPLENSDNSGEHSATKLNELVPNQTTADLYFYEYRVITDTSNAEIEGWLARYGLNRSATKPSEWGLPFCTIIKTDQ